MDNSTRPVSRCADVAYTELRHAVELLPFSVLVELVCCGSWCDDSFPCPYCQRGAVPMCSAVGDSLHWECLSRDCRKSGSRRTLEQFLLDEITNLDDAAELLATIRAVTA